MNYRELRLKHAEHNLEACSKLDLIGEFPDWVVTTAFYSAVHYVQHKVFPLPEHDGTLKIIK